MPMGKASPKGFSASKCEVGNWIFSKLGIFEKFFGFFLDFFWGFFWRNFFERFFFGRIFWRNILEGFFWEECFCQGFVSMQMEGKFQPLEVRMHAYRT